MAYLLARPEVGRQRTWRYTTNGRGYTFQSFVLKFDRAGHLVDPGHVFKWD